MPDVEQPLIRNPNVASLSHLREDDGDDRPAKPLLLITQGVPIVDQDAAIDALTSTLSTKLVEIDAKVLEGTGRHRKIVHYKNLREFAASPMVRSRIRKHVKLSKLKEANDRFREATDFEMGLYADEHPGTNVFGLQDTILPQLNSPHAKQQLLHDYMTAHMKSWEAATRNPLGKRIVKMVPQFVLARGLTCDIPEEAHQIAWDDFWSRHDMPIRIKVWLRELMTYGEQFNRHYKLNGKLAQRQVDPCTIWDVVTNPEDLEDVKYYYQQYLATSPITIPGERMPPSTLIIRHIPAHEIDHFTINKTSSEKRGRSELYAILGWLLRFKEFMNDRVLQNKMRAMFALDVKVTGGAAEVAAANAQFATPLGPGAVAVHNAAIEIEYKNVSGDAADAETDAAMILRIIAIGAGVSEQFLGVSTAQTRASALLQTEPDVKNFEDYQQVVEIMLHKTYRRLVDVEGLPRTKAIFEVSFPALASEDRSGKLKDLAMMEAQSWISKERAATLGAREMGISQYGFDREQASIRAERAKDPVVMQGFQSVPKVAMEPAPPGASPRTAKDDDGRKVTQTGGQMGYSAKGLSGRGLANTSATLDRGTFTRGGERASVAGQKSAGAPLRASSFGWSTAAREASLHTRRLRKLERLHEELKTLPETAPRAARLRESAALLEAALGVIDAGPAPASPEE